MSLRIWLPLLGNLNNNGLEDTVVTSYNTTVSTEGKIGSCYSFNGSSSYLFGTQNFLSNNTGDWSFCCWMKVNNAHNGCLFSCRNSANFNGITVFYYSSQWLIDDGTRWTLNPRITISANKWYHVCVVRKKGIGKYLYINGELDSSTDAIGNLTNVNTANYVIGGCHQGPTYVNGNWFNGYLNDVRFYDHALSIKEIKEISKALIVHYPLNGILPLNNIVRNEQYMPYNNYSKVGHTATVSGNTGLSFNGCKVWRLTYTPTSTNLEHVQTTLHGHGIYVAQKAFKADTKYCFWILWRAVSHPDTVCGGVASNIGKWTEIPTTKFNDEWNIVGQYRDGTVTVDKTDGIFTSFKCPSATADTPIIIDFCCPHLVEGYDYILDEDDYQDNFAVYDTSGYSNNTILYNNITNGDPIRYNKSTYFNGTDAFIACGRGSMVRDAITINFWAYMDDWTTLNVIASCTESGGYGFSQSSSKLVLWLGTGQSSNTYKNASSTRTLSEFGSGWHMITGTYDGFSTKLYVDGVLEGNNTAYTTKTPLFYNANNGLILGGESTGSQTVPESGRYTECNLSDFRVYATALSIDDIKELYNIGAFIDDNKNCYCYEITDSDGLNIYKTGVASFSNIIENDLIDRNFQIGKQVNPNLLDNNIDCVVTYTTSSKKTSYTSIPAEFMAAHAGESLTLSYDVSTEGDRYSAEIGETAYSYVRFGIHGSMSGINASGTSQTLYPYASYLEYSGGPKRVIMTWTVPTGWQQYGNLSLGVQPFDKPASTNKNIWFLRNVKIELSNHATPYVKYGYEVGDGDYILSQEFKEI